MDYKAVFIEDSQRPGEFALIDRFTHFIGVIQSDHSYIHDGIGYLINVTSSSINAGSSYNISVTTPKAEDGYIHWRPTNTGSTANMILVELWEGGSTSGGDEVTPMNRNRNSNRTSLVSVKKGATITPTTLLDSYTVGSAGGTQNRSGGGGVGSLEEIVFKPSTTYTIKITNIGASTATTAYLTAFWYEESQG
jgi:hypothetical protein